MDNDDLVQIDRLNKNLKSNDIISLEDLHHDNRFSHGDVLDSKLESEIPFIPFANQCVGSTSPFSVDFVEKDIQTINVVEEFERGNSGRKSGLEKIPIVDPVSNHLKSRIDFISLCSKVKGKVASIADILVDTPSLFEATLIERAWRCSSKFVNLQKIYNAKAQLYNSEYNSIWNVTVDLFRTIMLYGFQYPLVELRTDMIRHFLSWCDLMNQLDSIKTTQLNGCNFTLDSSRWMKVVKYKLAAFAAYAKRSTMYPKNPFGTSDKPEMLINSRFKHWFNSVMKSEDDDLFIMSLTDSLCRGVKKGCDRPSDNDCVISCLETVSLFTTHREVDNYLDNTSETLFQELDRCVDEVIIKPIRYELNTCPSFSSASDNSLHKGGHVKIVKKVVGKYPHKIKFEKKLGMFYDPAPLNHFNDTDEVNPRCYQALPSVDIHLDHAIKKHGEMKNGEYTVFKHNPNWDLNDLDVEELAIIALSKESDIKPIALKESLKTRGITTPPALESWLLKPLQIYLFDQLRNHKCFVAIGETLKGTHISDVIKTLMKEQYLVSGDYDNATNMILVKYTRYLITAICKKLNLGVNLSKLAIRSVCDCMLDYKFKYKDQKIHLYMEQKEAQPMGKILSFPLLCLINFMVCRKSIEIDTNSIVTISRFPGLINGDDCLFPMFNYKHWEGLSAMVGLNNSIGKTFVSRRTVEMNSRTFLVIPLSSNNRFDYNISFTEVPFINYGLVKGLVRSSGVSESEHQFEIDKLSRFKLKKFFKEPAKDVAEATSRMGWCHYELVKNLLFIYDDLDYLFKWYHNKYLLDPRLTGIPYCIPQWLGGIGLHPGLNPENKITLQQLSGAHFIYRNIANKVYKPLNMSLTKTCILDSIISELPEVDELQETPFTRIKSYGIDDIDIDIDQSYSQAYGHFIEYLWRSFDLSSFFNEIDEDFDKMSEIVMKNKLYHNKKLWYTAQKMSGDMLKWFQLWSRKQRRVKPIVADSSQRNLNELLTLW